MTPLPLKWTIVSGVPSHIDPAILSERAKPLIGPDPSHTDFELMLRAWHSGPAGRDVAMQMADLDRNRATRATRAA